MPSYSSPPATPHTSTISPQSGHDSEGDSGHPSSPDEFLSVSKTTPTHPTHTQAPYTHRVRPISCWHQYFSKFKLQKFLPPYVVYNVGTCTYRLCLYYAFLIRMQWPIFTIYSSSLISPFSPSHPSSPPIPPPHQKKTYTRSK